MLYLVQGRSGTGKTRCVCNILAELARSGDKKLLYLIPEQSSFESETAFLKLLGAQLCRNVSVMSFTRLYDMVMRETGGISGTPIDDGVRRIMMSLALEDCADKLEIYKRQAMKPQLADIMLNAVKEFKMCGIVSDDLREKAEKIKGTDLSKKLNEAALISDVYNAHISKSYIDPLDNNARLEKRLAEVKFFKDYTVVADGFSGFTAQEQKILDLIIEQSKDFYITLCMESEREDELFFTVNRTKRRIIRSAQRLGIKVASPLVLTENHRITTSGLSAVESGIYRYNAVINHDKIHDVTVCSAKDIFEECDCIAEQIKRITLGGEYRYKDIAVICRNSDKYRGILDASFESHDIPYFMSKPEQIDTKPLMLLVLSALEYAVTPSDCEKLFSIAKCGLLGFDDYEIAEFENYVYIWNLNGKKFTAEFTANPNGYGDKFTDEALERLKAINVVREKLMTPLIVFSEKIKNGNAEVISKAIYELLLDYNIPERLREDIKLNDSDFYSNEEIRLWDILMDMLNKTVLSLGDRALSVKRYLELFRMMVRSVDISEIPQTLDQVLIGTADSIRLSSPPIVFVIGAVNGEFPHNPVPGGIFNDAERRSLIVLDLPVYDAAAELFMQEKYLVYTAVSAAKNHLFVTYCTSDLSGSPLTKSSVVTEIERILPNVKIDTADTTDAADKIYSEKTAFEYCALQYRQDGALSRALKSYFSQKTEYSDKLKVLDRIVDKSDISVKDKKIAVALFGKDKILSASQIEKFYMCRFQYFCTYGLKLRERKRVSLDAVEYGNLVHYLLENVLKIYKENNYIRLDDDELESILDELLKKYVAEFLGGEDDKSERFIHLYYRLKRSTQSLMRHLADELGQSEFKPVDFELIVGDQVNGVDFYTVENENGSTVKIRGKIDRVDIMKKDKASYIRIVDYKTGSKEFKISDVLYGLNMQMLIYLSAVAKNGEKRYGENIHPSGVLYMPSTVTSVTVSPTASEEQIQEEHDKKLKMNGIILDEIQVLQGMEEGIGGKYIPASVDKNNQIKKTSSVISNKQLNMVFDKIDRKIAEMSRSLDNGDIAAIPVTGSYDACKWCIYNAVCGHEANGKNVCVSKLEKDEVFEQLEKEFETETETGTRPNGEEEN